MKAAAMSRRRRREGGAATVLVLGCVVVVAVLAAAWLGVTRAALARQRAETAADLAALAAAASRQHGQEGCDAAGEMAARNGGTLVSCAFTGDAATVRVRVGGPFAATAQARAGPESYVVDDR
jgi:secretion/DNA translocation related TadE-like protein